MYHNPTLHAIKLLKQHHQQDIDKIRKVRKLVSEGKTYPLDASIGNSPQDKFMILKILSQQQILVALDEVLNEDRLNNHRHAGSVSRRSPSITKKFRKKGNTSTSE